MDDVYEFRRAPGKGAIWLAAVGVVLLMTAVVLNDADHLLWLVWVTGAVTLTWMLLPKPMYGIQVDKDFLVMSAWRKPRHISLDDIAYLRAAESEIETEVSAIYKDGTEELLFSGDLPDVDTLIDVMAARGVPVRDVYHS